MLEWLIVLILIFGFLMIGYYLVKRAHVAPMLELKKAELEKEFERRVELEREDAIAKSRAALGGKFVEQLAPYLPEFKYDPTEARFVGSPIDLIIFPGLAEGKPEEIVIMEVKTGKTDTLTAREKSIQELVKKKKVRWELIWRPSREKGAR